MERESGGRGGGGVGSDRHGWRDGRGSENEDWEVGGLGGMGV